MSALPSASFPTASASARTAPLNVVLLHGLLSSPREFSLLLPTLRASGVRLVMPIIEGYSEPADARPLSRTRWQDWLAAAGAAVRASVGSDEPFVLGGLCCGGLLAGALAATGELPVHTLVMLSPTFAFDGWRCAPIWRWRHVAYALGLTRFFHASEQSPYGVKDERMRRWIEQDLRSRATSAVGPARLPLWAIRENERLAAHVHRAAPHLSTRNVVVHAREDELCSLAAVQRAFHALPAANRSLVVLEDSYHMVTLDRERGRVADVLREAAGAAHARRPAAPANVHRPAGPPALSAARTARLDRSLQTT